MCCDLSPLDAVDPAPGAAERGTIFTTRCAISAQRFAEELPADPAGELIELGRKHFAALEDFPEARAFWWPRFMRIAQWLGGWEAGRRASHELVAAEISGEIEMPLADGAFKLRGIADRIERRAAGGYVILDYKTGSVRTEKQVRTGLAPQLTLEAAILRRGGFNTGATPIPAAGPVSALAYVALKGGARAGEPSRSTSRRARRTHRPITRWKNSTSWCGASTTITSPIARSSIRCGKRATATMIISRA